MHTVLIQIRARASEPASVAVDRPHNAVLMRGLTRPLAKHLSVLAKPGQLIKKLVFYLNESKRCSRYYRISVREKKKGGF